MPFAERAARRAASVSLMALLLLFPACGGETNRGGRGGGSGNPPDDVPETTPQNPTSTFTNMAVSTAIDAQLAPKILADGNGGSFIVWEDHRSGTPRVYAQHVNAAGETSWAENGVPVSASTAAQRRPLLVSDGSGGFIAVWEDERSSGTSGIDLYAQRIGAGGTPQWTNDAVIAGAAGDQTHAEIVGDADGVLVVWQDARAGTSGVSDIYAQRLLLDGAPGWTPDGVAVSLGANIQQLPKIASDGAGGAIVAWERFVDPEAGLHHLYLQRIDAAGTPLWDANGRFFITWHNADLETAVQGTLYRDSFTRLLADGAGGAFVLFRDRRRQGDSNISMQRVSASGALQWEQPVARVSWQPGSNQLNPRMVSDGDGGVIVVWEDYRGGMQAADIYAQRLNASGQRLWRNGASFDGMHITSVVPHQGEPRIVSDGAGGAIVAWESYGVEHGVVRKNVYAQRVNTDGVVLWETNGVPIVTQIRDQFAVDIAPDGDGGAFIVWQDGRGEEFDIYLQHINADGG